MFEGLLIIILDLRSLMSVSAFDVQNSCQYACSRWLSFLLYIYQARTNHGFKLLICFHCKKWQVIHF